MPASLTLSSPTATSAKRQRSQEGRHLSDVLLNSQSGRTVLGKEPMRVDIRMPRFLSKTNIGKVRLSSSLDHHD